MAKKMDHVDAARKEAEKYGASFTTEHRTNHICGHIGLNGQRRKVFISVSPSDSRAIMNIKEDVRRKVREMI